MRPRKIPVMVGACPVVPGDSEIPVAGRRELTKSRNNERKGYLLSGSRLQGLSEVSTEKFR